MLLLFLFVFKFFSLFSQLYRMYESKKRILVKTLKEKSLKEKTIKEKSKREDSKREESKREESKRLYYKGEYSKKIILVKNLREQESEGLISTK
jgi:hypothetical protein